MKFDNLKARLKNPDFLLVTLLLLWWIVNLFQAALTELDVDETYYWVYSQHPAWGYFDHPPLTAWLIRLGTILFGKTALGVRFFSTLLQPIYLYLFWRLLRPAKPTVQESSLYCLLCASIPVLQAYGFIATPDAPLLFSTVLFLTAYRQFSQKNTFLTACFTGISIALLVYSKYHGFLVFGLVMLPDMLKLLRNPRFYLIALVTAILLLPHFMWLYEHHFSSIRFHLQERGQGRFIWFNFFEYFYNTILCYHPYLFILFVIALIKRKPADSFERSLYVMTIGFYLFFLFSLRKTAVQPQWLLPTAFAICYILFQYLKNKPKTTRAVFISSYISIALYLVVRVFIVVGNNTTSINFILFHNSENNNRIAQAVGNYPLLFTSRYAPPSAYMFYTGRPAALQLNIASRSNQYKYLDYDDQIAGQTVAVESDTGSYAVPLIGKKKAFRFYYYENYRPTRRIKAEFINMPTQLIANEMIKTQIKLSNPYSYAIPIGNGDSIAHVHIAMKSGRKIIYDTIPTIDDKIIKSGADLILEVAFQVPDTIGKADLYIGVQQPKLKYSPNNEVPLKVEISER